MSRSASAACSRRRPSRRWPSGWSAAVPRGPISRCCCRSARRQQAAAVLHPRCRRVQLAVFQADPAHPGRASDLSACRRAISPSEQVRPRSIDEMAADYVSLIRKIQPAGPYNLLGWSFGGLVAHAIATQLQAMGEEVALLALLDSYPVQHESAQAAFDDDSEAVSRQVAINPIRNLLDVLRREGLVDAQGASLRSHHGYVQEQHAAVRTFVPQRFRGDMSLFVATDERGQAAGRGLAALCRAARSRSIRSTAPMTT